jgi:transcriptional regulator with XRE-family HTH domain
MGKYDPAPTIAAGLLRTARDRAELTQGELAASAGVTQQSVSAYETGRRDPTLPTLMRLLAAAGFDLRMRLEPAERHDEALASFMDSLPPQRRAEIDKETRDRVEAARLRRVRGA